MTCEEMVRSYFAELKNGFSCTIQENGRICLVTPYLYPDHDNIEIFARPGQGRIVVSDLGETLRNLDTAGMDVCSNRNLLIAAKRLADGYGVTLEKGILLKQSSPEAVGAAVFDVISSCKAVASLIYGSRAYEPASFDDEVVDFLESNEVYPERPFETHGMSVTRYTVKMRVPMPDGDALLETLSPKTSGGIKSRVNAAFRLFSDIYGEYPPNRKISLVNDDPLAFKENDLKILSRVSRVFRWTDRQGFLEVLQKATPAR